MQTEIKTTHKRRLSKNSFHVVAHVLKLLLVL